MQPELLENTTPDTQPLEEPVLPETPEDPVDGVLPEVVEAQPVDVTQRLATEFLALCEEFPQIATPSQLPDCVLDVAAEEGIPLLDAYLRYRWQEEKKVAVATEHRRRSAASSAGSLSRGALETAPEQDAFLRAFRSAL